ncbi:hypothetical protein D3C80_811070 [compost metagenome]
MVSRYSTKTLSFISWQPVQNFSVLEASMAVLKPPQKMTPPKKPISSSTQRAAFDGDLKVVHRRWIKPGNFI